MSESPELEARVAKIQKDVEQLKELWKDDFHERRDRYEKRVREVLEKCPNCVTLWLEIDSIRSMQEIEDTLKWEGQRVPKPSLWRASQRLLKAGLIRKIAMKKRSPVYAKKIWATELDIDDFVRETFLEE